MAYLLKYRRGRGFGDAFPQGPLDASGLVLSPPGILPPDVSAAALDSLPATGLAPYNPIMSASTVPSPALNVNWWLVGAGAVILALGVVYRGDGGRR